MFNKHQRYIIDAILQEEVENINKLIKEYLSLELTMWVRCCDYDSTYSNENTEF